MDMGSQDWFPHLRVLYPISLEQASRTKVVEALRLTESGFGPNSFWEGLGV